LPRVRPLTLLHSAGELDVTNKIGGSDNRPVQVSTDRGVKRAQDSSVSGDSEQAAAADPVQITGSARHLAKLEQHLKELPAVDAVRVAQIRDALATGAYQIHPQRVADKMITMENEIASKLSPEK